MHYLIGAIGSVVANGSHPVVKLGQRDGVGFHPSMQIRDVASLLLVLQELQLQYSPELPHVKPLQTHTSYLKEHRDASPLHH